MAFRLAQAERRGLQLAILCRTVAFAVAGTFYVVSLLLSNSAPSPMGLMVLGALVSIGIAHYAVIGTRYDRSWLKFAMSAIDILSVCALMAFFPLTGAEEGVPQVYAFRNFTIGLTLPFVALAGLSLSPRLVLWAGGVAALGWWAAFLYVVVPMENRLSWSDMPRDASRAEWEAIYFSPDFVGTGTRMVETLLVCIIAAIVALAVARARRVYFAQLQAEAAREAERTARENVSDQLGRYVPTAIAERLIADPSGLTPQVRHGAALVMDIADFTAFAAGRDPTSVIGELNRFLARCADEVSAEHGVVITFTGDGLLATFNTPLEVSDPEAAAARTAQRLLVCGDAHGFRVRVGLAAGPIAAGSVGSKERAAFTVYGDTVNRAARLEALAKDYEVSVLTDLSIERGAGVPLASHGRVRLRGFGHTEPIFSLSRPNPAQAAPTAVG